MHKFLLFFISFSIFAELQIKDEALSLKPINLWDEFKSPFSTTARPWLITGATLSLGLLIFEDKISDPLQKNIIKSNPLGDLREYIDYCGEMYPNIIYALGSLGIYAISGSKDALKLATLMTKATLYTGGWTTLLKYTVREPRPGDKNDKTSFPSGHTSTAFAFAGIVAENHNFVYGTLAYTLATLVGYVRMNKNKHELQDVIAGATIGLTYSMGLSRLYKINNVNSKEVENKLQVMVIPVSKGAKVIFDWKI